MKHFLIDIIFKIINFFTIKKKNSMYAFLMGNTHLDHYDILNYSGSNLLSFLNSFLNVSHKKHYTVYIEYYYESRKDLYDNLKKESEKNNITLCFIKTSFGIKNKLRDRVIFLRNALKRFKCYLWFVETGDSYLFGKLKKQKYICFNYFISCKNDYIKGLSDRWKYLDKILTTSLLPSQILSASTGVTMSACIETGFIRDDNLLKHLNVININKWLKMKLGFIPKNVFLYVPTFRDNLSGKNIHIFGYDIGDLNEILKSLSSIIIIKLHPMHKEIIIEKETSNIVFYEQSFDFSLYDMLSYSTCLIGDYSSVGFDYLITKKPQIYNLYDFDDYNKYRGLSYYPYSMFCKGICVYNLKQLEDAIIRVCSIDFNYIIDDDFISLFHKNSDGKSFERISELVEGFFNEK